MAGFDDAYDDKGQLKAGGQSSFDQHYAAAPPAPAAEPQGGYWYSHPEIDTGHHSPIMQALDTASQTARTIGNDFTRGVIRAPSNIIFGGANFLSDLAQAGLDGTPWDKTSKTEDWAPHWATTQGADEAYGQHGAGLYSTDEPTDLRRYPGRAAEFAATTATGGGSLRSLIPAVTGGLGSQAGSDAFPGNKYASTLGGILGSIFGLPMSTIGEARPQAPGPSFPEMKAALDAETQDAGLIDYTPQVKDYANRLQQKKLIEGAQNLAETAHGTGGKALDAIQPIMDKAEPTFGPAMKQQWERVQAADSGGGLLSRTVKGTLAHGLLAAFHIPQSASRGVMSYLESLATKPNVKVLSELEKMLEVARTQKLPPGRSTGIGRAPAGLLGVLGQ